jgi:hypothetical protein
VVAATSVVVAVAIGLVGTIVGLVESRAQAARAQRLLDVTGRLLSAVFDGDGGASVQIGPLIEEVRPLVDARDRPDDFAPSINRSLAAGCRTIGEHANAIALSKLAIGQLVALHGPDDSRTIEVELDLARYRFIDRQEAAQIEVLKSAFDRAKRLLGPDSEMVQVVELDLAKAKFINDKANAAEAMARLDSMIERLDGSNPAHRRRLSDFRTGRLEIMVGIQDPNAVAYGERLIADLTAWFGERDPATISAKATSAPAWVLTHEYAKMAGMLREVLPALRHERGIGDIEAIVTAFNYAYSLIGLQRHPEAAIVLDELEVLLERGVVSPAKTTEFKEQLARYRGWMPKAAEPGSAASP